MSSNIEVTTGIEVICICEPRGEHFLDGFQLNKKYAAELVCHPDGSKWWRVFHDDNKPSAQAIAIGILDCYYEVCGSSVFDKYFRVEKMPSTVPSIAA